MRNGVYNKAVYWPDELATMLTLVKKNRWLMKPTGHYKEKASALRLPDNCYKVAMHGEIIEAEYDCGLVKIVTRVPNRYCKNNDLCFAVLLRGVEARVKTVWLNNREDNHYTLQEDGYVK